VTAEPLGLPDFIYAYSVARDRDSAAAGIAALRGLRGVSRLPAGASDLTDRITRCLELSRQRRDARPCLPFSLRERAKMRVIGHAIDCLRECSYRQAGGKWAGGDHLIDVHAKDFPNINGCAVKVRSANRKWSGLDSSITVWVTLGWYARVYALGAAIVTTKKGERLFTIAIEKDLGSGRYLALVGKQGRGFQVGPRTAEIEILDGTAKLTRWK